MFFILAAAKDYRIAARIGDGFGLVCGAHIRYVDAAVLVRGDGDRGALGIQDVALEFENGFFWKPAAAVLRGRGFILPALRGGKPGFGLVFFRGGGRRLQLRFHRGSGRLLCLLPGSGGRLPGGLAFLRPGGGGEQREQHGQGQRRSQKFLLHFLFLLAFVGQCMPGRHVYHQCNLF